MRSTALLLLVLNAIAFVGCAPEDRADAARRDATDGSDAGGQPRVTKAICRVIGTQGNEKIGGVIHFEAVADGLLIKAEITGLPPGSHGFHVHEFGDINCDDGVCAGGHFDPHGKPHGAPDAEERHVGDFGNLEADEGGKAVYNRTDSLATLHGVNSIIGRAIIIHDKPDDFGQPTGNAGGRVAYGVIGIDD